MTPDRNYPTAQHRQAAHFPRALDNALYRISARSPISREDRLAIRRRLRELQNSPALSLTVSSFAAKPSGPAKITRASVLRGRTGVDVDRFKYAFSSLAKALYRAGLASPWTEKERRVIRRHLRDVQNREWLSLTAS